MGHRVVSAPASLIVCLFFLLAASALRAAETFKPYVLAATHTAPLENVVAETRSALEQNGFELVGEYTPYEGARVLIVTSSELGNLAAAEPSALYLVGQRVAVTQTGDQTEISYANPDYLAHAYRITGDLQPVARRLTEALGSEQTFGSVGLTARKLAKYHYTFGMEYFDDPMELASYGNHSAAVDAIESRLEAREGGVAKVYRIDVPGAQATVFGVSMSDGMANDERVMGIIDYKRPRHTANLPYEIVVVRGKARALHPRFRLALHFPDIRMVGDHGFTKILSTPDAVRKSLTLAAGGKWAEPSGLQGFNTRN